METRHSGAPAGQLQAAGGGRRQGTPKEHNQSKETRQTGTPTGLLLAAGEGRRLGTPKALVEIDGVRLTDRGVRMLHEAGCTPIIVVTGAARVDVAGAVVVHNPDWRPGMGSSLRAGLSALAPDCPAVVIALVDQPNVTAEAVLRLRAAHEDGARVAV